MQNLISKRDSLDAMLAAMPVPAGSNDHEWEVVFDRKCDIEDAIMAGDATTIGNLRRQVSILAQRAAMISTWPPSLARLAGI